MALMTEERRKEMEEEMSRFELEIAVPGGKPSNDVSISSKPLSPPPPPPAVAVLIPEVLSQPPPPPPPSSSPPSSLRVVLRPPPPPTHGRPQSSQLRFVPHQIHRHPQRPPMRSNFIPMRGLHMGGPFPSPNMGPYAPPMGQGRHGPPMHHMQHGPMPMHHHHPSSMPPQMGGMNMGLPMPPGFCPPPGPGPNMAPHRHGDRQTYRSCDMADNFDSPVSSSPSTESPSVLAAAPAIYAAPFVKSQSDGASDTPVSTNGQDSITTSIVQTVSKSEKLTSAKSDEYTVGPAAPPVTNEEVVVSSKKKEKKKKFVRMAGGQAWEDNSLLDWENDDFRIFCGDLGNDVTDEVLIRAFSKYPSFVKAKVIRDKRTNKTKGYGFVSFKDPQDFIKAMREMNGKYVGSRPIKLRKSTWRDRNIDLVKKKQREKEKLGLL